MAFHSPREQGADSVDLRDVNLDAGVATFANSGTEQDALAEFLATNFPADQDPATPTFTLAETDRAEDTRIQNLNFRDDTVIDETTPTLNEIMGTNGRDFLQGTANDDRIVGRKGRDIIRGRGGNDLIAGNRGNDLLFGNAGEDTIEGGRGQDILFGGAGNDLLTGGSGADQIFGGAGDDTLLGGEGQDLLIGGGGADWFILESDLGTDTIINFNPGQDILGLAPGLTLGQLSVTSDGGDTLISLSGAEASLITLKGVTEDLTDLNIQAYLPM